eukprot:TRINITY_DN1056_c0_g2_i1.p1 TRINITY_DN1056_c0_g2~~TRINITY_DN1056_c0_g2_i1.p1  ORF type:complete len:164 (+),score=13.77 TRINITY_DN1056_c0_g2_i1:255-746(+)
MNEALVEIFSNVSAGNRQADLLAEKAQDLPFEFSNELLTSGSPILRNSLGQPIFDVASFIKETRKEELLCGVKQGAEKTHHYPTDPSVDSTLSRWPILDPACDLPIFCNFKYKTLAMALHYPNRGTNPLLWRASSTSMEIHHAQTVETKCRQKTNLLRVPDSA